MDFLYLGLLVGFTALSAGFVLFCERLRRPR